MRGLIFAAMLGATSLAEANPHGTADAHARRGVALYNLGKYEEAIVAFEQAYTLVQSDALLFNLAQAHRQLEHCELALTYYTRFMSGKPPPDLAEQVETLLPKLEACARTKDSQPKGPVTTPPPPDDVSRIPAPPPEVAANVPESDPAAASVGDSASTSDPPSVFVTGGLTAGMVISGATAATTGGKLVVTTPAPWLHGGELGVVVGAGQLWRGDAFHNATLAQLAVTILYRAAFDWGRFTIGGEVGGAYFSTLDSSSGVVPGITRTGQWAPLVRGEVGAEHDVAPSLGLRVAASVGGSPRVGQLLTAVGQLELMLGLRYAR